MAITTYAELQSAISDWLARSDLTDYIPDFIKLAEARMNRVLRTHDMETSSTVTMTSGSGPLPSNYLEWIEVIHSGTRTPVLRYVEPDSEEWRFRYRPGGDPTMFTILAGALKIKPAPASGDCSLTYYRSIPDLATNSTNWLLTRSPDLYLNYALAEAYIFIKQHDRARDFLALAEQEAQKTTLDGDSNKQARRPSRAADAEDIAAARNPSTSGR